MESLVGRVTGLWILTLANVFAMSTLGAESKPRLIVLTDIGGDPDDQQSMIRLLVHANEFEIEGLIASAAGVPGELKADVVKPELIREIVAAYGRVQPNLCKHHPGFPAARDLLDRIKSGNPKRGIKNLGATNDTPGSNWIISVVDRADERPVNVTIWGGSTELAQALWRVRTDRTPEQLRRFVQKLRVYTIGYQDDTGPWIADQFPDLFYIVSKAPEGKDKREGAYRGMYLGGDESLTSREWVDRHVRKDHGPLGELYPIHTWTAPNPHATLKEGDTPSWFYFLGVGLGDPAHPEWGGWGGRFRRVTGNRYADDRDTVEKTTDARATVWRWRPAYQNEFAARMDWCVQPEKGANHPPVVVLNDDRSVQAIQRQARPDERIRLSAAGSRDPDGDRLRYRWFVYPEAGTVAREIPIESRGPMEVEFQVPAGTSDQRIHVILEATDDGRPALTRYRRAVITVR